MKKYQVIGGQYEPVWYGESDSLLDAKQIASKNVEYWDNWRGWHIPEIYLADDVEDVISKGKVITRDGETIRVPTGNPYMVNYHYKWELVN